ncbi:MAG TPA: hypothetical protein VHE37_03025 [Nevskiaceae bacterium]|nr:hypothetical protein [Nevskiaceae bacterium]
MTTRNARPSLARQRTLLRARLQKLRVQLADSSSRSTRAQVTAAERELQRIENVIARGIAASAGLCEHCQRPRGDCSRCSLMQSQRRTRP